MRLITLNQEDLDQIKPGVSPSTVDALMKKVSEQLGETWLCAKDGATWFFGRMEDGKYVNKATSRRRKFVQALADATKANVAVRVKV